MTGGEKNDIFICSLKGSLLSPFMRNLLFFSHFFLSFFLSCSRTIDSNRSFYASSLHVQRLALSLPDLPFSLVPSLLCGVIAWLINYKGISKSEKRSWHFNLQRQVRRVPTHTISHAHRPTIQFYLYCLVGFF